MTNHDYKLSLTRQADLLGISRGSLLAWRLSVTLETGPCLEAFNEAMARYGKPEIMNTDQGSQFTSIDFIKELRMPGSRSAWMARGHGGTTSSSNGYGRTDQILGGLPARL